MDSPEQQKKLDRIKKAQENLSVLIGTVFVLIMCVDFFTYALLADKGMSGALWAMGISVITMLLILFNLKRVSFFLIQLWFGRRAEFGEIFAKLRATDL